MNYYEEIKQELINNIDVGNNAWQKSKTALIGYTLEHIIIKIDEDDYINRLLIWSMVLDEFMSEVYKDSYLFTFIKAKYYFRTNTRNILKVLNITYDEFNYIRNKIIICIYEKTKKYKLYQ